MSDINFLSNNKDDLEIKKKDKETEKVEWSTPKEEKLASSLTPKDKQGKNKSLGLFSFFKNRKKSTSDLTNKIDANEKNQKTILDIDKNKLKSSRHELINLIKDEERKVAIPSQGSPQSNKEPKDKQTIDKKVVRKKVTDIKEQKKEKVTSNPWFKKMFKKKDASKGLLFDPQEVVDDKNIKKENVRPVHQLAEAEKKEFDSFVSKKSPEINSKKIYDEKEKKSKFDGIVEQRDWKNPKILETNLVRGEISSFFDWKRGFGIIMIYIIVASFIIGGIYGGLVFWEKQKREQENFYSSNVEDVNKQIEDLEEDVKKIISVQKKIKLASDALDKHIYWSNFFKFLENNTLSNVYFLSFSGDTSGEYSLAGKAKNFQVISDQVNTFRSNDYVVEAFVSGGNINNEDDQNRIDFQLKLSVDKNIFIK